MTGRLRAALAVLLLGVGACSSGGSTPAAGSASPSSPTTSSPVAVRSLAPPQPTALDSRVEHRFEMGEADFLAVEAGSVWVKRASGRLERVDPATNAVASLRIEEVGNRPCDGLGAGEGTVWSCVGEGGLARIDPATNAVVATVEVGKDADQTTIPVGFGHAWALSDGGVSLVGVSLASNAVDVRIALDRVCNDLALGADGIWAACFGDGEVLRIDPTEQQVTARVSGLPGARVLSVSDAVYVGFAEGTARIEPRTATVTAAVDVRSGAFGASLAASPENVWVRTPGDSFLQRLDPTTLEVTEVLSAPERSGGSVLEAFGSVWATAFDDAVLYRLRPTG